MSRERSSVQTQHLRQHLLTSHFFPLALSTLPATPSPLPHLPNAASLVLISFYLFFFSILALCPYPYYHLFPSPSYLPFLSPSLYTPSPSPLPNFIPLPPFPPPSSILLPLPTHLICTMSAPGEPSRHNMGPAPGQESGREKPCSRRRDGQITCVQLGLALRAAGTPRPRPRPRLAWLRPRCDACY